MKVQRIEELMAGMKSFSKERYHKRDVLNEMFALQKEIVELTFNGEHATTADLKIWDVEKHLEQLNEECGHVADKELHRFMDGSKTLCNLIKAEISGNRGEYKAFKSLENLQSQSKVMRNVELSNGQIRAEIDLLVITSKCITIVEVKNTAKDIIIDKEGNYYRTGEYLKWDCNIAEKMAVKEELLRKVLDNVGFGYVQIRSIVVFTNNRIEVQNKYSQIKTCFVNHLADIVEGFGVDENVSMEEMDYIQNKIEEVMREEEYPFAFDVRQYQKDFATLMATLEFAKVKECSVEDKSAERNEKEKEYKKKVVILRKNINAEKSYGLEEQGLKEIAYGIVGMVSVFGAGVMVGKSFLRQR